MDRIINVNALKNMGTRSIRQHWCVAAFMLASLWWNTVQAAPSEFASVSGMRVFSSERNDGAEYRFATGPMIYQRTDTAEFTRGYRPRQSLEVRGDHQRQVLDYSARASARGVAMQIEDRLRKAGFDLQYACSGAECGDAAGWRAMLSRYAVGQAQNQFYVLGMRTRKNTREYAAYYVNEVDDRPRVIADLVIDAVTVEDVLRENAQAASVLLSSASLLGTIDFAPGKSQTEIPAALPDEIKQQLIQRSGKIVVVGYTDDSGGLLLNHELAVERAHFVQGFLHRNLDVPLDRILAQAVGPFTPPGREPEASRRVEIWGL